MSGTLVVVGAGASGMMAAISAARHGAQVTILEAQDHAGKKLLVTGSGRCNLTNLSERLPDSYHGSGKKLAAKTVRTFGAPETLTFFHELGLLTMEKNGWVYPYTMTSGAVLDVLMTELRRLSVNMKFNQKILVIRDLKAEGGNGPRYEIETPSWTYQADALLLACGSMAAPSTGAGRDGYLLAQALGHSMIRVRPALVPLSLDFPWLNRLSGVRSLAKLTLRKEGKEIASEAGELQWTRYGISGIVTFQISRFLTEEPSGYTLQIDFLPDYQMEELFVLLCERAKELGKEPVSVLLRGFVHEKLIRILLETAHVSRAACADLKEEDLTALIQTMKNFSVPVRGTRSFDQAQICAGGVDCSEVTGELESRLHDGLYFAGELLDVDGPCGGYNLQWAWSSGYLAGKAAALSAGKGAKGDGHGEKGKN